MLYSTHALIDTICWEKTYQLGIISRFTGHIFGQKIIFEKTGLEPVSSVYRDLDTAALHTKVTFSSVFSRIVSKIWSKIVSMGVFYDKHKHK